MNNNETNRRPALWLVWQFLLDAFAWILAVVVAAVLRYDFNLDRISWNRLWVIVVVAVFLQAVIGYIMFLYRGRYSFGSFPEVKALWKTGAWVFLLLSFLVLAVANAWELPKSLSLISVPIALLLMFSVRFLKRLIIENRERPNDQKAERIVVYGAGYMGENSIRRMLTDKFSPYVPVAIVDDNPAKKHVEINGVRVQGRGSDLVKVAEKNKATAVLISIARADSTFIRKVTDVAVAAGLRVLIVPTLDQLFDGSARIRDISIEDIVGRSPVELDTGSIADYVRNKKVLVTGAGGSIGSELCRQLARFNPSELMMLDRDESALQGVQLSIAGHGLLDTKDVVLADIRDTEALQRIFRSRQPDVVFHAAALKHVPMLEQYPLEAWQTNVIGTLNVLQAAMDVDVDTFVNVSTDKAANPASVLGHSKRVAEKLTAWAGQETGKKYLSVRFGNVLGSRGSLLPTFQKLIDEDKPLTVTHKDATRYFMSIPEASQLVIQAGAIGDPGEVLVLDMGEPIRIYDIAKRMIAMSGKHLPIEFTGLRHGEKLHEELFGNKEVDDRPKHPKISHTTASVLTPQDLDLQGWIARCDIDDETSVFDEVLI